MQFQNPQGFGFVIIDEKNINQQSSHPVEFLGELASFLDGRLKRDGHRLNNTKQFFFRVNINVWTLLDKVLIQAENKVLF